MIDTSRVLPFPGLILPVSSNSIADELYDYWANHIGSELTTSQMEQMEQMIAQRIIPNVWQGRAAIWVTYKSAPEVPFLYMQAVLRAWLYNKPHRRLIRHDATTDPRVVMRRWWALDYPIYGKTNFRVLWETIQPDPEHPLVNLLGMVRSIFMEMRAGECRFQMADCVRRALPTAVQFDGSPGRRAAGDLLSDLIGEVPCLHDLSTSPISTAQ